MAELKVQPKKKKSILPWILLLLGIAALIWFLTTRHKDDAMMATTSSDTTATASTAPVDANSNQPDWNSVDFNAPAVSYDEITNKSINVRGNNSYGIYGLGENILFDEGKATIRSDAEANLKQIAGSIGKRYANGNVKVYGYTDAKGSAASNKELAQERTDAVKGWLQNNGFNANHISESAIGEAQPVATNSTEEGRQQNRRVEIVALAAGASK